MANEFTLNMVRENLYAAVISDALDGLGFRHQSPRLALPHFSGPAVLVGRCKTTLWADMYHKDPQPYELELRAVDSCQTDDVMICAAGGSLHSALWGELLTTAAKNSGCIGAIVDGAVRDIAKIRQLNFSVYARGSSVYDSQDRQRVIDLDVPVEMAGVRFSPGDLVIADLDGIVVVPQEVEAEALQRAWDKVHAENRTRDAIRGGLKAAEAYKKFGVL